MQRGGWDREESTYRDFIKDKDQAIALEQQARVYRSEGAIDFLLGELSEKYTQDPENLDTARRIAELYEEKNDLENAVTWFSYAAQLSQNTDFALVRKVSDLRISQFDNSIASFEESIAGNPDSPDLPEHVAQLEEAQRGSVTSCSWMRRRNASNATQPISSFALSSAKFSSILATIRMPSPNFKGRGKIRTCAFGR